MLVDCYAARDVGKPLEKFQYEPEPLSPWEVEVAITHCGICHSDIHLIDDDWGISTYPLVPGHEIVGTVTAKGKSVNVLKRGVRVGIGWQRSACLSCEYCLKGLENICPKRQATCVAHYGGFARSIRIDSRFAFCIPEELDSASVAPLLCGGITVYSPLHFYNVAPPMKVGVIGIGGLGHMALQFARAIGCEVTAFSSTPKKEKEAKKFGAHRFIPSTDKQMLNKEKNSLDFIITTVFVNLDWEKYLQILKPGGKLCFVGAPLEPLTISAKQLIVRKSICGSNIGGRHQIREMLEFAARHKIKAQTELLPLSKVNSAVQRVRDNKARYRIVLETDE